MCLGGQLVVNLVRFLVQKKEPNKIGFFFRFKFIETLRHRLPEAIPF